MNRATFNMSSDLFNQWCCVNRALYKVAKIQSKNHLINITQECFKGDNLTPDKIFDTVIHLFRNSSITYTEEACNLPTKCSDPADTTSLLYVVFWCLMLILTVASNSLVIIANQKISYLKQNTANMFITSLAVSDLLVAVFVIPLKISFAYHNLRFCHSTAVCRFHVTTDNAFFSASITNLFVITIDRYIALNHPYRYPRLITKSRSRLIICFVWLYGAVWGSLTNFTWTEPSKPSIYVSNYSCQVNNFVQSCFSYALVFYIPVAIMGVLYFRIYSITKYHAKSISESAHFPSTTHMEDSNNNIDRYNSEEKSLKVNGSYSPGSISRYQNRYAIDTVTTLSDIRNVSKSIQSVQYRRMILKAIKTIATVFGTFVICWTPVSVLSIVQPMCPHCFTAEETRWCFIIFVEVLPILNSTMNPFIYAITNKQYRQAFKELLSFLPGVSKKRNDETMSRVNTMTQLSTSMAQFTTV